MSGLGSTETVVLLRENGLFTPAGGLCAILFCVWGYMQYSQND